MTKKIFYIFCVIYLAIVLFLNYIYDLENTTLTVLFGVFLVFVIIFKALLQGEKEKWEMKSSKKVWNFTFALSSHFFVVFSIWFVTSFKKATKLGPNSI